MSDILDDEERAKQMKLEWKEMEAFVADCINSPRLYIKKGLLEPVHLQEVERKILVEGM